MKKVTSYDSNAAVHPTVIQWENDYTLPAISGTAKQQKYARDVRYKLLRPTLSNVLEVADCVKPEDRSLFFKLVNQMRGETDPAVWIALHQEDTDLDNFLIDEIEAIHERGQEEMLDWMDN
jgi:hypothetical protein